MMIKFEIMGQLKSGKNNMGVSRKTGRHYPLAKWARWRDDVLEQIMLQRSNMSYPFPITVPSAIFIFYYKADLRRRDVPGMEDALWHCLERAGIIEDDSLFDEPHWFPQGLDRENPRVGIIIETKEA